MHLGVTKDNGGIINTSQYIGIQNNVPVPLSGAASLVLFYIGKDWVSNAIPFVMVRAIYPGRTGSLTAGATEVFNVKLWEKTFIAPVGKNTQNATDSFQMSAFHVMASKSKWNSRHISLHLQRCFFNGSHYQ